MKNLILIVAMILALPFTADEIMAQKRKKIAYTHNDSKAGKASFYHDKFNGRKTATGETFRNTGYTAASNFFKLGTYVKVTNKKNSKTVYVKINDRMGHPTRVIDLTHKAASDIKMVNSGIVDVEVEEVTADEGKRKILAQQGGTTNTERHL